jgi:NADH:ubiquinone oxidoreductase subunit E
VTQTSAEAIEIVICMGSSCFARGNAENLRLIKQYSTGRDLNPSMRMKGQLCRDRCTVGPSITIDGIDHHGVSPANVIHLLESAINERKSK